MIRVLSATGFLGYGFNKSVFFDSIKHNRPDVIAVDASSSDPGPFYLGSGEPLCPKGAIKEDLMALVEAAVEHNVRVIIGGACGSGENRSLDWMLGIIKEISEERNYNFDVAVIRSNISKEHIHKQLEKTKIESLAPQFGDLTHEMVDASEAIVAQIGPEPFIEALKTDAKMIIAGRAIDNAMFAALPIAKGYDEALAWHMGKTLECAGMVAVPTGIFNSIYGEIDEDSFTLYPADPKIRCTMESVVSHSLYERDDPYIECVPGGVLDLSDCKFEQLTDRSVRVKGSKFTKKPYFVKLEGAAKVGYRSITIWGVRDPILIKEIDYVLEKTRELVKDQFKRYLTDDDYKLNFYLYGKNAVMGEREIVKETKSHELGIVAEGIGKTQGIARDISYYAYGAFQHLDYPGILCTGANVAIPFSPPDIDMGAAYEFNIYHLMPADPVELFKPVIKTFGRGEK